MLADITLRRLITSSHFNVFCIGWFVTSCNASDIQISLCTLFAMLYLSPLLPFLLLRLLISGIVRRTALPWVFIWLLLLGLSSCFLLCCTVAIRLVVRLLWIACSYRVVALFNEPLRWSWIVLLRCLTIPPTARLLHRNRFLSYHSFLGGRVIAIIAMHSHIFSCFVCCFDFLEIFKALIMILSLLLSWIRFHLFGCQLSLSKRYMTGLGLRNVLHLGCRLAVHESWAALLKWLGYVCEATNCCVTCAFVDPRLLSLLLLDLVESVDLPKQCLPFQVPAFFDLSYDLEQLQSVCTTQISVQISHKLRRNLTIQKWLKLVKNLLLQSKGRAPWSTVTTFSKSCRFSDSPNCRASISWLC